MGAGGLKGDAAVAGIKGYVKLPSNNNTALLTALATTGPSSTRIELCVLLLLLFVSHAFVLALRFPNVQWCRQLWGRGVVYEVC
jgi:hypothetical protein